MAVKMVAGTIMVHYDRSRTLVLTHLIAELFILLYIIRNSCVTEAESGFLTA